MPILLLSGLSQRDGLGMIVSFTSARSARRHIRRTARALPGRKPLNTRQDARFDSAEFAEIAWHKAILPCRVCPKAVLPRFGRWSLASTGNTATRESV